jgi:hypothetical protein
MGQIAQPSGTGVSALYTKLSDGTYVILTDSNGLIQSSALSAFVVQTATVSLSAANILALNATPITLVAAQGAGTTIIVDSILVTMTTTATQFANGGAVEFRYTDASGAKVSADLAAAVVTATAGTTRTLKTAADVTAVANAPIVVDNATAPFITGTGTAVITVNYHVV